MKPQNVQVSVIFLFLFCSFLASARLLPPKQGYEEVKANGISHAAGSLTDLKDISDLMGLEKCGDNDEECLQRRMIAEAHLDYIYTQHHKP
ncbi:putative phytosulfokines 6 [Quercus robur]|uniref:putative phytosulfokines 6 n=1 Tax=Quercus robur TaxID=38942 RepID=UPI00216290D2|nr:putative phytosulfokines 6 [Quercus robur]